MAKKKVASKEVKSGDAPEMPEDQGVVAAPSSPEETQDDSVSGTTQKVPCDYCHGTGLLDPFNLCPACNGMGMK